MLNSTTLSNHTDIHTYVVIEVLIKIQSYFKRSDFFADDFSRVFIDASLVLPTKRGGYFASPGHSPYLHLHLSILSNYLRYRSSAAGGQSHPLIIFSLSLCEIIFLLCLIQCVFDVFIQLYIMFVLVLVVGRTEFSVYKCKLISLTAQYIVHSCQALPVRSSF